MSTQYICPSCGLPVEVDTDTLNWDADGNGRIVHNSCGKEITIARPVSQGFRRTEGGGYVVTKAEEASR